MSTKHSKAAEKFLQDSKMAAWHNETLWMVRAKRDKMSKEVPEWEELRNKACELKLYSNSHLEELLQEFEKNATANGAIVHWAKDADEYCAIVYEILNEHNVHHFIKSKSMLAEECGLNPFLMERGIDVVESDLGERILQLCISNRAISFFLLSTSNGSKWENCLKRKWGRKKETSTRPTLLMPHARICATFF